MELTSKIQRAEKEYRDNVKRLMEEYENDLLYLKFYMAVVSTVRPLDPLESYLEWMLLQQDTKNQLKSLISSTQQTLKQLERERLAQLF